MSSGKPKLFQRYRNGAVSFFVVAPCKIIVQNTELDGVIYAMEGRPDIPWLVRSESGFLRDFEEVP